jgi:polyribonucleotide nucleotidyltransferase
LYIRPRERALKGERAMKQRVEMPLGRSTLSIETGHMAKQADGATVVRLGDTVVLTTACAQREPRVGFDFLPLTVDYREGNYAGGKIPGGFFKREGRPNEKEVLTSRMIDRPLRPLFPEGYACETQVVALLLSADLENDGDTLAIVGASTALYISDIPFENPVGAVRVGFWDGECHINPATNDLKTKSLLNLLVAGTEHALVMCSCRRTCARGSASPSGPSPRRSWIRRWWPRSRARCASRCWRPSSSRAARASSPPTRR